MALAAGALVALGLAVASPISAWADTENTTSLTSTPNPSHIGDPVTFTATVAAPAAATGTVSFKEGATEIGTATLDVLGGGHNITAGDSHSCALSTDSEVKCCGNNFWGQIGDVSNVDRSNPVAVTGLIPTARDANASGR
jgi:hypothetical protein